MQRGFIHLYKKSLQCYGKVRRAYLVAISPDYVRKNLDRRVGNCQRCGACCKILFKCAWYKESNGEGRCTFYNQRPGVCMLFPIDRLDLRDRDMVAPRVKCGFSFSTAVKPTKNNTYRRTYLKIPEVMKLAKDTFPKWKNLLKRKSSR